uniref:ATP synthase subunit a n=1 Tax=Rhyacophila quadrifida TaxID=2904903 RepID=A0A9E8RT71_9NEOP|nr:ATP synthase F0 subunit 6 [Rhyacophila quadrifida]UZZ44368.1 ATP synthase F0 subunit 6 [Rhyacophila quadrifida]
MKLMANLFSVFDPSTNWMNLPLNWLSMMMGLIFIPISFWLIPPRLNYIWNKIIFSLHLEFKILLGSYSYKGSTIFMTSLFTLIFFNNFLGMFPYIFTSTSHLVMTLSLALPLWISLMMYGWINNTNHMFAHLIPQSTPMILIPFMVMIESISNIIRPMTLSIRLTANMIAGHLLLTLLSNSGSSISIYLYWVILLSQILLLTLEFAVAIIQSYVFSILSTLYSSEVN